MSFLIGLIFVAVALGQQMQDQQQRQGVTTKSIQDALRSCSECSSALRTIFTNDALETIPKDKPFTLLIPNNQAVMKDQSALMMIPDQQRQNLVKAHILSGAQPQLKEGSLSTLAGSKQQVSGQQDSLKIGDARVVGEFHEIPGGSGSGYYVIDKVFTPEVSQDQSGSQSGAQSQSAQATQATLPQGQAQQGQTQAIWQLVQNDPQISQIGQIVQQNPVLQQLLSGPLTFFLPNNDALTQVQQRITQIPREKIVDFVRYHIVYGVIPELQDGMRFATLLKGADLNIRKAGDKFMVNNANVLGTFKQAANNQGYYVIDKVLFPEEAQQGQVGQGQLGGQQPPLGGQQPPSRIVQ